MEPHSYPEKPTSAPHPRHLSTDIQTQARSFPGQRPGRVSPQVSTSYCTENPVRCKCSHRRRTRSHLNVISVDRTWRVYHVDRTWSGSKQLRAVPEGTGHTLGVTHRWTGGSPTCENEDVLFLKKKSSLGSTHPHQETEQKLCH